MQIEQIKVQERKIIEDECIKIAYFDTTSSLMIIISPPF